MFISPSYSIKTLLFTLFVSTFLMSPSFAAPPATSTAQTQPPSTVQAQKTININQASPEALAQALNGVGLKKAQAIVKWREQNGSFTRIDQLTEVTGIGEKIIEQNRAILTL